MSNAENKNSQNSQSQTLRRTPSKKAEVRNIGSDIMIYTQEGYAFIDLLTAEEIAELLPIYLKKAKRGITDKDTRDWVVKTFGHDAQNQ